DRLERAQAQGRELTRAIKLDAKLWPAFEEEAFESEKQWLWNCVERLEKEGALAIKTDKVPRDSVRYACNPRVISVDELALRRYTGRGSRVESYATQWRGAVMAHLYANDETKEYVSRYLIEIAGRSALEVVERLNDLQT